MLSVKYILYPLLTLCIGSALPARGEEVSPLKITVHTDRIFKQQPGKVDPTVVLEKLDPVRKNGDDPIELELKFLPLESRIEIFSVEAALKSGDKKVTLGIGYEERHALDGERGTEVLIPGGGPLKVSSASTNLVASGCYVSYAIGPRDAMTFILSSTDLSILYAWRSPIKDTPLASTSSRLEKLGPDGFRWVPETGK